MMTKTRISAFLSRLGASLALVGGLALPTLVHAAEPAALGGTLKKIADSGVVYLGHYEEAVPFSFVDDRQQVMGYSWDLCGRVVEAIKAELGRNDLQVVPVPLTSNNRLMMLRTGVVDLECGATTNTPSRQRQVAFSYTTFVATTKLLVKADSPVRQLTDLNGRKVISTFGSGAERFVKTAVALRGAELDYDQTMSSQEALARLAKGEADAFVLDAVGLAQLRAGAANPEQFRILEDNLSIEPYALMLRKDDAEFKKLVDTTLGSLMKSGEVERLYEKWFLSPIPPKGLNLNLPLSPMLKELLANPSDRAG